jgi:phosphoribosylformylglycinamidine cyclo-ligase
MDNQSKAYKEAGVDLQAADQFVDRIKKMAADTHTKGVITDIGLFSGMFKLNKDDFKNPVLVSSTDGVGTKLRIAFEMNKHDTIGIDLVAMNVNDIVVHGAKPLFFLDYLATGHLDIQQAEHVVAGIVAGCKQAKCALLGGETAELPGFYTSGEYDLSGFCVGLVDQDMIVDGSGIALGDKVIGITSSGLHSNGFSLVRKVITDNETNLKAPLPGTDQPLGLTILEPTKIYVQTILNILRDFPVKGMAHITGGGFLGNIPRILPKNVRVVIDTQSWSKAPVSEWIKEAKGLSWSEMFQIFNCGIGLILIVDKRFEEDILIRLQGLKEEGYVIGEVVSRNPEQSQVDLLYVS